ncbi:hypothetical protein DY000_02054682 [Brassica cretica]|uniref:Myb-like domain-containing protein n=1 Tax=Brassica cretica TaxID=69181 RepID=A0ABQ7AFH5_BRACR|nr:hypothetical protein DY000_02054682 [Brassica cretica]
MLLQLFSFSGLTLSLLAVARSSFNKISLLRIISMDNHSLPPSTSTTGLVFPSLVAGGVKPEAALVMDWSVEEQYVLENGLAKLKDEPKISKYVKIAAALPDKTVRDVALRCRWMARKRRKREEISAGKNISNRKVVDTSPELNMLANLPQQNALYANYHSTHLPFEGISDAVLDLVQQNAQAFSQISYNLSAFKLQDNISLLYQARNNISAILNDMKEMPGIMSRMPPLPVSINDDLASRLLPSTTQVKQMSQNQESLVSFSLTLSAFLLMLWILFTCLAANIVHHATKHPHEARAEKLIEEKWILTNAIKK